MKVMITGGLGHIGSHVIQNLPENFEIVVVDNLFTQRFCSLFNRKRKIHFLDKDISDIKADSLKDIDAVIHLAAITNSAESFKNRDAMEDVNIIKTEIFINACRKAKVSRFLFPSSTSVYGINTSCVYENNDKFINPQSPYAEAKIRIEKTIKDTLGKDTRFVILRFGTIFGISSGMRFHTAINKFCYQIATGKPLTIWKQNYKQVRPYLGINDAINSINFFLESNVELWNDTYNVLTSNYSLYDIIEMMIDIDKNIAIEFIDTPLVNQYSYHVSDEKIKNLGFMTHDDMLESIKQTLHLLGHNH